MVSNIVSGLSLATKNISSKYKFIFEDVVTLWLSKLDSLVLNIQILCQTKFATANSSYENTSGLSSLIGNDLITFPSELIGLKNPEIFITDPEKEQAPYSYRLSPLLEPSSRAIIKASLKEADLIIKASHNSSSNPLHNDLMQLSQLNLDGSENQLYLKYLRNVVFRTSVSIFINNNLDSVILNSLNLIFKEIFLTWQSLEKLQKRREEEFGSIYKEKKSGTSGDMTIDQLREADLKEWFPEFYQDFSVEDSFDVLNTDIPADSDIDELEIGNQSIPILDHKLVTDIIKLHSWIFNNFTSTNRLIHMRKRQSNIKRKGLNDCVSPNTTKNSTSSSDTSSDTQTSGGSINQSRHLFEVLHHINSCIIQDSVSLSSEIGGYYYSAISSETNAHSSGIQSRSPLKQLLLSSEVDAKFAHVNTAYLSKLLFNLHKPHRRAISKKAASNVTNSNPFGNNLVGVESYLKETLKATDNTNSKVDLLEISTLSSLTGLAKIFDQSQKTYDFYHDSNEAEAMKIFSTVKLFLTRINELLAEYEDNSVLQLLKTLSIKVLNLPRSSPIAKLLSGLEVLLTKGSEWEKYNSSKATSVLPQLGGISKLIVEWRQLELNSWPFLMQIEMEKISERALQYWFYLFNSFVSEMINIMSVFDEEINLDYLHTEIAKSFSISLQDRLNIIGTVDQFLQTSPIGEFETRLSMLKSILKHRKIIEGSVSCLLRSVPDSIYQGKADVLNDNSRIKDSISGTLNMAIAYYEQYLYSVKSFVADEKDKISKEISSFVKISTFSDVNPESLKMNAKRTHSHLSRSLRKLRDVLEQPFNTIAEKTIKSNLLHSSLNSINIPISFRLHQSEILDSVLRNDYNSSLSLGLLNFDFNSGFVCSEKALGKPVFFELILGEQKLNSKAIALLSGLDYRAFYANNRPINHDRTIAVHKSQTQITNQNMANLENIVEYLKTAWDISDWTIKRFVINYRDIENKKEFNMSRHLIKLEMGSRFTTIHKSISQSIDKAICKQFTDFEKWFDRRNSKLDFSLSGLNVPNSLGFWYTPYPNPIIVAKVVGNNEIESFFRKLKVEYSACISEIHNKEFIDLVESFDYSDTLEYYFDSLSKEIKYHQTLTTPSDLLSMADSLVEKSVSSLSTEDSNESSIQLSTKRLSNLDINEQSRVLGSSSASTVSSKFGQKKTNSKTKANSGILSKEDAMEIQNKAIKSFWTQKKIIRLKLIVDTLKQLRRLGLKPTFKNKKHENENEPSIFNLASEIALLLPLNLDSYQDSLSRIPHDSSMMLLNVKSAFATIPLLQSTTNEHIELLSYLNQAYREAYFINESKKDNLNGGRSEIIQDQVDKLFSVGLHWSSMAVKERNILANNIEKVSTLNDIIYSFSPKSSKNLDSASSSSYSPSDQLFKLDLSESNCKRSLGTLSRKKLFISSLVSLIGQSITCIKDVIDGQSCINEMNLEMRTSSNINKHISTLAVSKVSKALDNTIEIESSFPNSATLFNYLDILESVLNQTSAVQSVIHKNYSYVFNTDASVSTTKANRLRYIVTQNILLEPSLELDFGSSGISKQNPVNWNQFLELVLDNIKNIVNNDGYLYGILRPIINLILEEQSAINRETSVPINTAAALEIKDNLASKITEISKLIAILGNAVTVTFQSVFEILDNVMKKSSIFNQNMYSFSYLNTVYKILSEHKSQFVNENLAVLDQWGNCPKEILTRNECFEKLSNSLNIEEISSILVDIYNSISSFYGNALSFGDNADITDTLLNNQYGKRKTENIEEKQAPIKEAKNFARTDMVEYVSELSNKRVFPLISQYYCVVQHINGFLSQHHYQFIKNGRVFTQMITTIFSRGVASSDSLTYIQNSNSSEEDEDIDQDSKGDREFDISSDPTGLGEGNTENAKNVSNEIDTEDQILGAEQLEKDSSEKQDEFNQPQTNEDSIEMSNDFEGQIGDADLDPVSNSGNDSDISEDESPDMDEQLGKVDITDPTAVDEKMWNDESNEKLDSSKNSNPEKQLEGSAESGSKEQDIVAKDEESNTSDKANQKSNENETQKEDSKLNNTSDGKNENDEGETDKNGNDGGEDAGDQSEEDDPDQDPLDTNPNSLGAKLPISEVSNEQNEQLEIPDDLNLDMGSAENENETEMDFDPLNDEKQQSNKENHSPDAEMNLDEKEIENLKDDEHASTEEEMDGKNNDSVENSENQNSSLEEQHEEQNPLTQSDDINEAKENENEKDKPEAPVFSDDYGKYNTFSSGIENQKDEKNNSTGDTKTSQEANSKSESKMNLDDSANDETFNDDTVSNEIEDNDNANSGSNSLSFNPTLENKPESGTSNREEYNTDFDYEFSKENEKSDNFALADTDLETAKQQYENFKKENEIQPQEESYNKDDDDTDNVKSSTTEDKLDEESTNEENNKSNNHGSSLGMINTSGDLLTRKKQDNLSPDENSQTRDPPLSLIDALRAQESDQKDERRRFDENELLKFGSEINGQEEQNLDPDFNSIYNKSENDLENSIDINKISSELGSKTEEWFALGEETNEATVLWNNYILAGQENATRLSEQLKLILEPTLSSHLKGDYRTGKRLNMKKIIPYIASQFKRDKIWLRRTKPMKREYQVLLAIDNSKSMLSSQSVSVNDKEQKLNYNTVKLTFETLALLTNSLQLLEVGEMGIVSFGSQVNVLHPFNNALTLEQGAKIISGLKFNDESTDIHKLLEEAISLFNGGIKGKFANDLNPELWKLMIILSDGICQNHSRLREIVLRAAEMKIMMVFIVLDRSTDSSKNNQQSSASKRSETSITEIKQVQYKLDSSGKPQMTMTKYLDTFPFEFYLVLRDINSLPETVGRGNTVKALQHRYTVNDKTKISAWIKAHNMRDTGSWMDLQMRHPDIKLGLQDIGKIRMGCYWTAQRLAKAGLIPKMYIERCPDLSLSAKQIF
ncbi:hypothetical protein BB560_001039 [Smittium megazygosporum]|uniref:VWFA domain-containing protein n=1 Tax=Smittium megazygosporum TaxID=133381 RepID=A0A2T9ZIT4_9FUNG|nr:hypothetical protein BB560_001039 [Smittium megazygosporum]